MALTDEEYALDQADWQEPWSRVLQHGWPSEVVDVCKASLNAPNPLRGMIACTPPDYFSLSGLPGVMIVFLPPEDPRVQHLRDACDA